MKKHLKHSLRVLGIVAGMASLFGCGSNRHKAVPVAGGAGAPPPGGDQSLASGSSGIGIEIMDATTGKVITVNEFTSKAGESINMKISVTGANAADYSIAYKSTNLTMQISGDTVQIAQPRAGEYIASLIARNRTSCSASPESGVPCEVTGQKLQDKSQFDLDRAFVLHVIDPVQQQAATAGVGQGGGMIGQILRGEGLLGSLAKGMMGGMLGNPQGGAVQ